MKKSALLHSDLQLIQDIVFQPCGFELTEIETEVESQEYCAHHFKLDGKSILFRKAKITPTKTGQFVTVWKRNEEGITSPYEISDDVDFFIIAARQDNKFGIFIFPKVVLHKNCIISDAKKDGKRGIRVYPTWDTPLSQQAQKTQLWQTKYFFDLSEGKIIDQENIKILFS